MAALGGQRTARPYQHRPQSIGIGRVTPRAPYIIFAMQFARDETDIAARTHRVRQNILPKIRVAAV